MSNQNKPELLIREIDEETVEYWVGETLIIRTTHDEDGWSVTRIRDALIAMADLNEMTIKHLEVNNG